VACAMHLVTNLNVGTQIIGERSEHKIFFVLHVLSSCSWNPFGGIKADPQTSSSGEVVLLQWGVTPPAPSPANRTLRHGK